MKTNLPPTLLLTINLLAFATFAQKDWKLVKEDNGVKVYVRDHKASKIKEFRAITTFQNAELNHFYMLFKNGNQASKWSYAVDYSKTLASLSTSEDIVYYQMDTPWPLQKRDAVQKQTLTWKQNGQELVSHSHSIPQYLPEKKGFIRVEESSVKWVFRQANNGNVEVVYEFYTDPKVPVPDNLMQYFIVNGPIFVFEKLRGHYYTEYQTFGRNSEDNK